MNKRRRFKAKRRRAQFRWALRVFRAPWTLREFRALGSTGHYITPVFGSPAVTETATARPMPR
jgi:hypothetical protein